MYKQFVDISVFEFFFQSVYKSVFTDKLLFFRKRGEIIRESCGNKEAPDTNAYPIQTVGKEKTTEQDGVKQKYVIPSKKNKDSAASSEKQEEYTTEPKNFVEFVERKTARRMMVDAKMLMYELGFLKDVKQTDIECAVINQYQIAAEKKVKSLLKKLNFYIKMLHVFHKYCRN